MRRFVVALSIALLLAGSAALATEADEIGAALKRKVAELTETIRKLEGIVEGTARPVNLARTRLAAVSASSVNAGRELDNCFYGVGNAFDDGRNVVNGIHYTYWLSNGEPSPWIDVAFDEPVSVAGLFVEGETPYSVRLFGAKGGEADYGPATGKLDLERIEHGIERVRLTFRARGMARVDEVRVLGYLHPETESQVADAPPRVAMNACLDESR
jgi:hypothetical protein